MLVIKTQINMIYYFFTYQKGKKYKELKVPRDNKEERKWTFF